MQIILLISMFMYLLVYLLWHGWIFYKSDYYKVSGNRFLRTLFNRGNYGEYLTYKCIKKLEGYNKILTNVYLPTDIEKTTEIDLVMISQKGIFVFESKNYSGWIFGHESHQMWTQTLKGGQKNKFFNPIMQNKGHVAALNKYFGGQFSGKFFSYIVFSERCTLKSITVWSKNTYVVKRNELISKIKSQYYADVLTTDEVDMIYNALEKYTKVDKEIKERHRQSVTH